MHWLSRADYPGLGLPPAPENNQNEPNAAKMADDLRVVSAKDVERSQLTCFVAQSCWDAKLRRLVIAMNLRFRAVATLIVFSQ
jgi:hypothetical protein